MAALLVALGWLPKFGFAGRIVCADWNVFAPTKFPKPEPNLEPRPDPPNGSFCPEYLPENVFINYYLVGSALTTDNTDSDEVFKFKS